MNLGIEPLVGNFDTKGRKLTQYYNISTLFIDRV